MKFWFVNLGKYYKEQRDGCFLWAPIINKTGRTEPSWENLSYVRKGDVIFCNNKGYILSIAIAECSAYKCVIPNEFEQSWRPDGRRIDLKFIELDAPLRFSDYKDYINENINKDENPFDVNGNAKMGYLFPIDEIIAKFLIAKINNIEINNLINTLNINLIEEMEELKEEMEQFEKINNGSITTYTKEELEQISKKEYQYTPTYKDGKLKIIRENTDQKLKATILELANYMCEVNNTHITFSNSSGEHQYMECHHIIPMKAQKDFPNKKLDNIFNLISLCPICHSQIHYSSEKEKKEIFYEMYKIREREFLKNGFNMEVMNEIFNKYYKNVKN